MVRPYGEWIPIGAVGHKLGISAPSVKARIADGRLHPLVTKLGALFDPDEVAALARAEEAERATGH